MINENISINEVDEYIFQFDKDIQDKLFNLRKFIKDLVPEAKEKMSYGMPTFVLYTNLIHFAAFKTHIGIYPGANAIEIFKDSLSNYKTSKGTIQIPIEEELPFDLIKKIVEFRIVENKEKKEAKKRK